MSLQSMEYMIAISEEKSLSRAAERLLISQAALSQHVKKLETELDARLFERQHGHLVLTDAGRVYVNGARRVLDIYNPSWTPGCLNASTVIWCLPMRAVCM